MAAAGQCGGDSRDKSTILRLVHETLDDVGDNIIIVQGPPGGGEFISYPLHLGEVGSCGEITLPGVADLLPELDDASAGLRGETLEKSAPSCGGRQAVVDLQKDFSRKGCDKKREHLLVLGNPDGVLRVGADGDLLLAGDLRLRLDLSGVLLDRAIQETHHAGRPDVRQHLSPPDKEVLPVQLLGDGVAKGGESGRGHGGGG